MTQPSKQRTLSCRPLPTSSLPFTRSAAFHGNCKFGSRTSRNILSPLGFHRGAFTPSLGNGVGWAAKKCHHKEQPPVSKTPPGTCKPTRIMQAERGALRAGCWQETQPEGGHEAGARALYCHRGQLLAPLSFPLPLPPSGNPPESIYLVSERIPHLGTGSWFGPCVTIYSRLNNLLAPLPLHLRMTLKHAPELSA